MQIDQNMNGRHSLAISFCISVFCVRMKISEESPVPVCGTESDPYSNCLHLYIISRLYHNLAFDRLKLAIKNWIVEKPRNEASCIWLNG